jgi:hypothetical protein
MRTARAHRAAAVLAACALALVLLAAPAAHAWRELLPYAVPHGGVADCLRPAGAGEVALLGRLTRTSAATELLDVNPGGIAPHMATTLGDLETCAEIGQAPGVAPLLAGNVFLSGAPHWTSALRVAEAGGPPVALRVVRRAVLSRPAIAVAPNGAAVVAWSETLFPARFGDFPRARVLARLRPAGTAAFGAASVLARDGFPVVTPRVGIDAAGTRRWRGRAHSRAAGRHSWR